MWSIEICVDGCNFITIDTHLTDYDAALNHCRRLYGDDVIVVNQSFNTQEINNSGGLLSSLFKLL